MHDIDELVQSGATVQEVAEKLGIVKSTAYRKMQESSFYVPKRERLKAQLIELQKQGKSVEEIAGATGRSVSWIERSLRELGIPRKVRKRVTQDEVDQLLQEGLLADEIAKKLGCGRSTVYRKMRTSEYYNRLMSNTYRITVRMISDRASVAEIAKELNKSPMWVGARLKEWGFKVKPRKHVKKEAQEPWSLRDPADMELIKILTNQHTNNLRKSGFSVNKHDVWDAVMKGYREAVDNFDNEREIPFEISVRTIVKWRVMDLRRKLIKRRNREVQHKENIHYRKRSA